MVIDSSVWVAMVLGETGAERYVEIIESAIENSESLYVPASVITEAGIVLDRRGRGKQFDTLLNVLRPEVIAIDGELAEMARRVHHIYGRPAHKANLNFGDCLVYAACVRVNDGLLFVGDDFPHTDVRCYPVS